MKRNVVKEQISINSEKIAAEIQAVENEVVEQLAMLSRTARNWAFLLQERTIRQKTNNFALKCWDKEFEITQNYRCFCWYYSTANDNEQYLVSRKSVLMSTLSFWSDFWMCDEFSMNCPLQFLSLHTVHLQLGGYYIPCLQAPLSNKL